MSYGTNTQAQSGNPPGKGMAIASMVMGIVSMFLNFGGIIGAIIGLVLGINAKAKLSEAGHPTGMATAGIVLNAIAGAVFFIWLLAYL
jgi:hypothetical protein